MMTLEQASAILIISAEGERICRGNFIRGGMWMKAQILQMMNKASVDFKDEQKEVIDQFCEKIYEQLKEIDK